MKLLSLILLISPITVFGFESPDALRRIFYLPDALPPYGIWECEVEAAADCSWSDHSKLPECELASEEDLKEGLLAKFALNTESSLITFYPDMEEKLSLHYVGPKGGVWTYIYTDDSVFEISFLIVISPSKHTFTFTMYGRSPDGFGVSDGTCTNITPKGYDKPTEDEAKD
jgi:hypothetical protein